MQTLPTTFFLHELKGGASSGHLAGDFAIFRPAYEPYQLTKEPGAGEYKISTLDWIKRGRPVRIDIAVPPSVAVTPLEESKE